MKLALETKALAWAVLAALLSVGSAWLGAMPIRMLAAASPGKAQETSTEIVTSPELVDQGSQFYAMSCSHCHGDDATGDEGPNLHNLAISNARIAATIRKGIKGEMPTFAKKYDDRQIAALVSYLRTLR